MKPSNTIVCVINCGHTAIAERLAEQFGKVYYYNPTKFSAFPTINGYQIGQGLKNITVLEDIWSKINEIDIFIFTDIYQSELQKYLVSIGKLVWGSKGADKLEIDRIFLIETLKKIGLPVLKHTIAKGFKELREALKKENVWVKINKYRGEMETWHSHNYNTSLPYIEDLEHKMGVLGKDAEFVVTDTIDTLLEIGYDGISINGMYPKRSLIGVEIKDCAYAGKMQDYLSLPSQITDFTEKIKPFLAKEKYCNFFSTENRVDSKLKSYMIDPCMRMPSPPGELQSTFYTNLAEIIIAGVQGECIEPKPIAKWGIQINMSSQYAECNILPIEFPKSVEKWVHTYRTTIQNGNRYIIPDTVENYNIGSVVGIGNTLEEAINHAKSTIEKVKAFDIEFDTNSIDKIYEEIAELKKNKINVLQ